MTRQTVREAYQEIRISSDDREEMAKKLLTLMREKSAQEKTKNTGIQLAVKVMLPVLLIGIVALTAWFASGETVVSEEAPRVVPETIDPAALLPDEYRRIIYKNKQASRENWNPGQYEKNGMSHMAFFLGEKDELGYWLQDLDGNGIEELMITDGDAIFDLYTMRGNRLIHIASGSEDNTYRLCEQNRILNTVSDGIRSVQYMFLYLVGSEFIQEDIVRYDTGVENGPWFVGFSGESADAKTAEELIDTYRTVAIPVMVFPD